ncbi:MAG: OmpA family protein, partial [Bacteroidota bacterium]
EEASPFLTVDQTTLYFSSNGFSGYGKKDIYVTKRLDDSWLSWSEPENLGRSVNTDGDDVYFNIPTSGKRVYFTRGDVDEDTDIFSFESDDLFISDKPKDVIADADVIDKPVIDPVEEQPKELETPKEVIAVVEEPKEVIIRVDGNVLNEDTNEPVAGMVIVERLPDGLEIGKVQADEVTGAYAFSLKPGARYGIRAEAKGYLSEDTNVDLNDVTASETIEKILYLRPLATGATITFNNVFFDFDKDVLKTASYPELERVLELLKSRQIDRIEISGHTDTMGPDEYNLDLSQRRANTVYQYFVDKGIDKSRMEVKAYGESKPTHPNTTIANRQKNRRVEFKVLQIQ